MTDTRRMPSEKQVCATRVLLTAGVVLVLAGLVETAAAVGYGYPGALILAAQAAFMRVVARTVTRTGGVS